MHSKHKNNYDKLSTTKNNEQSKPTGAVWGWQTVADKWLRPTEGLLSQKGKRAKSNDGQADASIFKPRRFSKRKVTSAAIGSLMLLSSMAPTLHAGTITVTEPTIGGSAGCDLVEAIEAANNDSTGPGADCATGSGADTILFSTSPNTINLLTSNNALWQ